MDKRKFKKGDLSFSITSNDEGGATIDRFEVLSIGYKEDVVQTEDLSKIDSVVTETVLTPIIEIEENVFKEESLFFTQEEIKGSIDIFLNRKKLY